VQRWTGPDGSVREDARPTAVRPAPANRLSEAERDRIVATCHASEFASRSALCPVHWTGQPGFA
jgi:hypothetical protein